jgi:hypothetical protein
VVKKGTNGKVKGRGKGLSFIACLPKFLPKHERGAAADTARDVNPANRPRLEMLPMVLSALVGGDNLGKLVGKKRSVLDVIHPDHLALLTTKYWGGARRTIGVRFLDTNDAALRARILEHANEWSKVGCIAFAESPTGEVRITLRGDGYWSYLGTDILHIPNNQPTMSLQGFSIRTPEGEYKRVVRHEFGHTLGFPHEHMLCEIVQRLDPAKTIAWGQRVLGWDAQTVTEQILTPIEDRSLLGREPADTSSIMCYQLPGEITRDGKPIPGGPDLDEQDREFVTKVYPKPDAPPPPPGPSSARLFRVTLPRDARKGQLIYFTAPVPVSKGSYDWVPSAGSDKTSLEVKARTLPDEE